VGELARQTGLSVRTLHYYDEIGLLCPSHHTESGHRLYVAADVARLQQIKSLRQLGFSLEEVRGCLQSPEFAPLGVLRLHAARLTEQIEVQRQLVGRLERIARALERAEEVSAEEFIRTIEAMTMLDRYYTPEQLKQLEERRAKVGEDRIREVEAEWPALMEEVKAEMEKGTDPADPRVQALAQRWMGLVGEFTGGDPGIENSVKNLWQQEQHIHGIDTGPVRQMMDYIQKALAAGKGS
jgi:DNA-binding transcriptional MerR regulator